MSSRRIFNLLKPVESPKSSWDKIYDWITGRARIVLLALEIVMVCLFIVKIYVDNQAKNLLQEYEKVELEMRSLEEKHEAELRTIIARVNAYYQIWDASSAMVPILEEVNKITDQPSNKLTIGLSSDGTLNMSGYESIDKIKAMEEDFKKSDSFETVTLSALSQEQEDIISDKGNYSIIAYSVKDLLSRLLIK